MTLKLSRIGLGTFPFSNVFTPISPETGFEIVEQFVNLGGDYIETAPIYPKGDASLAEILGSFDRSTLKIGTKCGIANKDGVNTVSGEKSFLRDQIESELSRLDLDHIDLLQTHVTPPDVDPTEIAETLSAFRDEGLVRAIGVSNCTLEELKAFCQGGPIEWVQVRLSIVHRYEYAQISEYCAANSIKFNPFQIIERGQLLRATAAKRRDGDLRDTKQEYTGDADRLIREWFSGLADQICREDLGANAIATAWALAQPAVGCAVLGATSAEQVVQNWKALDAQLTPDEIRLIDASYEALLQDCLDRFGVSLPELRGVVR